MNLPSRNDSSKLLDIITEIKENENQRTEKEKELFEKLAKKEITTFQLLKELNKDDSLKKSKDLCKKFSQLFLEYNNKLLDISKNLDVPYTTKYKRYKKSKYVKAISEIKKLFKTKKKEKVKKPETKKIPTNFSTQKAYVNKEQKRFTDNITNLFALRGKKVAQKKEIKKEEFIPNISKHDKRPEFSTPKELQPENYQVLIPGFAYAMIEEKDGERKYIVVEPELNEEEKKILEDTKQELINKISLIDLKDENSLLQQVKKIFDKKKIKLSPQQEANIIYYIGKQIKGLDIIEPLMHDPLIEDIEQDGTGIPIFIVHRKYGNLATNLVYDDEKELQQFVIKMAHLCKSYVSYASPLLDSILPDGSRVNATLTSNVSTRGPTFTIRKFPQNPLTAIDLAKGKTLNSVLIAYLWTIMEFRKTVVIIGPTAAGKTTLLNVITSFIPPGKRVVSIEDTREINLLLDNWVPHITRPGFGPPDSSGKKYGEVTMGDLIKESFRQRPDYLIIGEVRGEEISLMFQGMASGHCCLSTLHARSLNDLVNRLITPPIALEPSLLTSLDVVIVGGFSGGSETKRSIKEIDEVRGFNIKENKIEYNAVYNYSDQPKVKNKDDLFTSDLPITYKSEILKDISKEYNLNLNTLLEVINNRIKFIEDLIEKHPKDYVEFKLALNKYKATEDKLNQING